MKKQAKLTLLFTLLFLLAFMAANSINAENLTNKLKGKILLQVEQNGEAWYVNPEDEKRYYMGRPNDAFTLMKNLGIGISNNNLEKIQIADSNLSGDTDSDGDGLSKMIEDSLNTSDHNTDSDNDGYGDKDEILNGYNPNGNGKLNIDNNFSKNQAGKILLQVEKNGEAWYINPDDNKRYFLGRPADAFNIMRSLGLGINDNDLQKIAAEDEPMQDENNTKEIKINGNITKDSQTGYYEYSFTETIEDYSIERTNGFDFIKIENFDQYEKSSQTPVLPYKRFEIFLPKGSEISKIIIDRSNPVEIENINIPVISDGPEMPGIEYYIEAEDSIEIFSDTHDNYTADSVNYTSLILDTIAAEYNTLNDNAVLYKTIDAKIIYDTDQNAILLSASPDKQYYYSDEMININIQVKNVTDKNITVNINNLLNDRLSKNISSKNTSLEIRPLTIKQAKISFKAPLEGGGYRVKTIVEQNQNIIGEASEYINIDPGNITSLEAENYSVGDNAKFKITFGNKSQSEIEAAFGLTLYQGSTQSAEFFPIVYDILPNTEQIHTFFWDIPDDFVCGEYLAVASVTVNDYIMSESQNITINCD